MRTADAVQDAFEAFDSTTHLIANSVREAQEILADVANRERIDPYFSDMTEDGST
jgi:hypothetical protein